MISIAVITAVLFFFLPREEKEPLSFMVLFEKHTDTATIAGLLEKELGMRPRVRYYGTKFHMKVNISVAETTLEEELIIENKVSEAIKELYPGCVVLKDQKKAGEGISITF